MSFAEHINKFASINSASKEMFESKKVTLRKVNDGIIATSDERPSELEYWIYIGFNEPIEVGKPPYSPNWFQKLWDKNNYHKILASTFGAGMELYVEYLGWGGLDKMEINKMEINSFIKVWDNDKNKYIDFDTQYEYRIESDKLIITL